MSVAIHQAEEDKAPLGQALLQLAHAADEVGLHQQTRQRALLREEATYCMLKRQLLVLFGGGVVVVSDETAPASCVRCSTYGVALL